MEEKMTTKLNVNIPKSKIYLLLILFTLTLSILTPAIVLAEGDGSGGGQNNPLSLVSSDPSDGETDVDTNAEITMEFSKNVVNMSVRENNAKCFELKDEDSNIVPIEIIMADDQMERELRNSIIVKPVDGLKEETTYILHISSDLMSKSGANLKSDLNINFSTGGTLEKTTSDKPTENVRAKPNTVANLIIIIVFVLLVAGISIYTYRRKNIK
jgi:hypothetical protein